jgi:hypothetical protein
VIGKMIDDGTITRFDDAELLEDVVIDVRHQRWF